MGVDLQRPAMEISAIWAVCYYVWVFARGCLLPEWIHLSSPEDCQQWEERLDPKSEALQTSQRAVFCEPKVERLTWVWRCSIVRPLTGPGLVIVGVSYISRSCQQSYGTNAMPTKGL